jgi:uncharacterized protein (DUF2336 family)
MSMDEAARIRQGANAGTSPDVLRELARDPSVKVRASVAMNPSLPPQLGALLAADADARVRSILSRKLSTLTPGLSGEARQRMQQDAVANLTAMVAEAALRVRTTVAEAVKDLADGPREIVLRLAHDPAVMVCEPVIRFSPMLTQEDLITLIACGPPSSTVVAVASRRHIGSAVSDAIVGTADTAAIGALLANHTAQIREATLDALAAQSEEQTEWQAPLVHRPSLPPRAQRMLAEIVTGSLLETLAGRSDLDPKVAQKLRSSLSGKQSQAPKVAAADRSQVALMQARALHTAGKLDDRAIVEALRRNAREDAIAMLAVRAEVPVDVIERACGLRSAKGIVSLAWKAGLSVQTSVALQSGLAQLAPDVILRAGPGDAFGLSEDEMQWQLAFLSVEEQGPRAWTPRRLTP